LTCVVPATIPGGKPVIVFWTVLTPRSPAITVKPVLDIESEPIAANDIADPKDIDVNAYSC
jgi:hypothetical protein